MAKAKGTHALQLKLWLQKNVAPADLKQLSAAPRHQWLDGVLVNLWYDMDDVLAVFSDAAQLTGSSVRQLTKEVATRNAQYDLRGVHRVFLRYSATTWSLGMLPSLWRAYFDFGEPRVIVNERGNFRLETTIAEQYVEWVQGGWEGFLQQMAILTGAVQPNVEVQVLPSAARAGHRVVSSVLSYRVQRHHESLSGAK